MSQHQEDGERIYKLTWVIMVVLPKLLYFERNSSYPQYISIVEVKTIRQYLIHVDITLKTQLQKPRNMIYNYLKNNQIIFNFKAAIAFVYQLPRIFSGKLMQIRNVRQTQINAN